MFSSENKILKRKACAQVYAKHLSVRAAALSLVEHPASKQQIHKYVGKHWTLHVLHGLKCAQHQAIWEFYLYNDLYISKSMFS